MERLTKHPSQSGFTLFELMITIGLAALILGIGIPNLRQFIWNNRLTAAANDFVIAVNVARAEAIKLRRQTIMCFSSDPTSSTPTCNGNGTQGWIVFADGDNDTTVNNASDVVLRHSALPTTISVRTKPDTNGGYLSFGPSGFSRSTGLGASVSGVVLCDSRGNIALYGATQSAARGITISTSGRPQVTRVVSAIASTTLGGCP
jgi:type IV fimbrial biogenesis protein FimT